jgi:hypothetical protein
MQPITNVMELAMGLVATVVITDILITACVSFIVACDDRRLIESHSHIAKEHVRGNKKGE